MFWSFFCFEPRGVRVPWYEFIDSEFLFIKTVKGELKNSKFGDKTSVTL